MKNKFNLLNQREKELDGLVKLYRIELPKNQYNQIELLEKIEECKYKNFEPEE